LQGKSKLSTGFIGRNNLESHNVIPQKLHQVWLGHNHIPEEFVKFTSNWRKLHPDWQYKLWTEETISNKPQIKNLVDKCEAFSSKSNVVRLYAVYLEGGVYADMDIDWFRNFDELLNVNSFASPETNKTNKELGLKDFHINYSKLFCNAIFGAVTKSEWVNWQIKQLSEMVSEKPPWGPTLMTNAVEAFKNTNDFQEYPSTYFYPYFWNEEYTKSEDFKNKNKESYVVHHWESSWDQKK